MVKLGDEVKDTVSGFKGIAVSRHSYLEGCDRITIQPKVNKDGTLPEEKTFDEPTLEVIKEKRNIRKSEKKNPDGPEKYSDIRRY